MRHWANLLILMAAILLNGCAGLRLLPDNEILYTGAELKAEASKAADKRIAENVMQEVLTPESNPVLFGMRPSVWVYESIGDSVRGPIRKWLRKTLGSKPVVMSDVQPAKVAEVMQNHLFHNGFFNAKLSVAQINHGKTTSLRYTANGITPFVINKVSWPKSTPLNDTILSQILKNSIIHKGDRYRLDLLKEEQNRIVSALQSKGYYFFSDAYLLFVADTTKNKNKVDLQLLIKPETPKMAFRQYHYRSVMINATYAPNDADNDTVFNHGICYITDSRLKTDVLFRRTFVFPGDIYSKKDYNLTYDKFSSLSLFRYLKPSISRYKLTDSLDVYFDLVPRFPMSFNTSFDLSSSSNNYAGPGIGVGLKHRNIFHGAEVLSLNLDGQYQAQLGKSSEYYYEIGLSAELLFPRAFPFKFKEQLREYNVFTSVKLGGRYQDRVGLYTLASLNSSITYQLSSSKNTVFYFAPIDLTYIKMLQSSDGMDSILTENPYLQQSFEEQLIPSSWVKVVKNNFNKKGLSNNYYLSLKLEGAGNLLNAASGWLSLPVNDSGRYTLVGQPFSQYFRFESDIRYYFNIGRSSRLALRWFSGAGIPYGNSAALPYIRQFYCGGPDDLRAFYARSIGPGTVIPPEGGENTLKNNQTGEVKLGLNAEFRFGMLGFLKGALFLDAGNIWMLNDSYGNEGKFAFNRFYKELAVGTGFGLRMDFDFLLVRFDLALPLRKPWIEENNGWVANKIAFGSSNWRRDNLILNIALGYPF